MGKRRIICKLIHKRPNGDDISWTNDKLQAKKNTGIFLGYLGHGHLFDNADAGDNGHI